MNLRQRCGLYLDAARSVQVRQLFARVRRGMPPSLLARGAGKPPPWQAVASGLGVDRAPQSGPLPPPHEHGHFSGYGSACDFPADDFWTNGSDGLLFLFHLHGFAPLAEYAAGSRNEQGDAFWATVVTDWLSHNAKPQLPAWHPYPLSSRITAWTAALAQLDDWPEQLRNDVAAAIWQQAHFLRRRIEHDIGGNHVLKNATGLIFAGSLFPRSSHSDLLDTGLALLHSEIPKQFLDDGGHIERSSSYHRSIADELSDIAELLARCDRTVPTWLSETVARAQQWQRALAGPGRRLPLLNDAWEGPPLTTAALTDPITRLEPSGYTVLRHQDDQLIFDTGPLAPRHLPPHAHADALAFVLWADGRPLLVDPGSYLYTGEWRDRFRGTTAHNTVTVDEHDQCQFWGDFRAAFLPDVESDEPELVDGATVLRGCHNGYRRLPDPVTHRRTVIWLPGEGVVVVDVLEAKRQHSVRSSLQLAPGVTISESGRLGPFTLATLDKNEHYEPSQAWYAPYLGTKVESTSVSSTRTVDPKQLFGLSLLRTGKATLNDGRVTITGPTRDTPLVIAP